MKDKLSKLANGFVLWAEKIKDEYMSFEITANYEGKKLTYDIYTESLSHHYFDDIDEAIQFIKEQEDEN